MVSEVRAWKQASGVGMARWCPEPGAPGAVRHEGFSSGACALLMRLQRRLKEHRAHSTAKGSYVTASYEVRDGIAVVAMDNPPVNSLGLGNRRFIAESIARAQDDAEVLA